MRVLIKKDPFLNYRNQEKKGFPWEPGEDWPCKWVFCPVESPSVTAYRRFFTLAQNAVIRVHVSADERYELFLDGVRIGRGSERGDKNNWFYETYELDLTKGEHVLVARTWALGRFAPWAQMTVAPGFIFAPEDETYIDLLGTGVAPWEGKQLEGYEFTEPRTGTGAVLGTGGRMRIDGNRFDWEFATGGGEGWVPVFNRWSGNNGFYLNSLQPLHIMRPALLPPLTLEPVHNFKVRHVDEGWGSESDAVPVDTARNLLSEQEIWGRLAEQQSVTIPPGSRRRVIIDLEDYYCVYPELTVSGGRGSKIRLSWAESLFYREGETEPIYRKGNRNEINGKYFLGAGDEFLPDGGRGRKFETLWWQAGRYLELMVETAGEPLLVEAMTLTETGYSLSMKADFHCHDQRLERLVRPAFRSLQMCAHETYMDCPYYEQLMYLGDTRLQALVTYILTGDGLLARKTLQLFDASRLNLTGLTTSAYPNNSGQIIPPFTFWWVAMVHDYALWRGEKSFIQSLLPGVRAVLDRFLASCNDLGLLPNLPGWNYIDETNNTTGAWWYGIPPGREQNLNSLSNWLFVMALRLAAELEEYTGEKILAQRFESYAQRMIAQIERIFWDDKRGMYADDPERKYFSEHAQILAILAGKLDRRKTERLAAGLFGSKDLAPASIWFSHYYFEVCGKLNRMDKLMERMEKWFDLKNQGFVTMPESFHENVRSDCHAWGSHPLYHYFATILGIRPGEMAFQSVEITPRPGSLSFVQGTVPHPYGEIGVTLGQDQQGIYVSVVLPEGLKGWFIHGERKIKLRSGKQEFRFRRNG